MTQRVRGEATFYFLYHGLLEKNKQHFHVCSTKNTSAKGRLDLNKIMKEWSVACSPTTAMTGVVIE